MKTYRQEYRSVIDSVICDVCGINCNHEHAILEASWGYYSTQDGVKYDIHMCESCFRCCLKSLKLMRETALYRPENDPLTGSIE